ncbi:hypothetical protein GP486_004274 [Trichoglossum hirsutum]|uniref:Uncharacterized protein n=1 Tax=Trichoglossum hirsutum TaxID=265104 RepID=A0A9P8LB51_9PEZI|nr:hypothetical protein GP486_004274 [Trichoglossum hirsutum]
MKRELLSAAGVLDGILEETEPEAKWDELVPEVPPVALPGQPEMGYELEKFELEGCELEGCELEEFVPTLVWVPGQPEIVGTEYELEEYELQGCELEKFELEGCELEEGRLEGYVLEGGVLGGFEIEELRLEEDERRDDESEGELRADVED